MKLVTVLVDDGLPFPIPAKNDVKLFHKLKVSPSSSHSYPTLSSSETQNQHKLKMYQTIFIISCFLAQTTFTVEIIDLVVPSVVEVGSENVVLDCNYAFEDSEASELEVKWYFNEDPSPFLQWIAGRNDSQPQVIGSMFEDKIDLSYTMTSEQHTKHRAIMIHKPTIDMAGTYHCKVDTLSSEAVAEANMLVYSPVQETQFSQKRLPGSKVNVSCMISGVFPLPTAKLTWGAFELFEDHTEVTHQDESYMVTIHKVLEHEELPTETVFGCEVYIPGTEYYVREEAIYHHRGRRSSEMDMIRDMERRRQSKEKVFYSSNTVNKLDTEEVSHKDYSSTARKLPPGISSIMSLLIVTALSLF